MSRTSNSSSSPSDPLTRYLQHIRAFPLLTPEEEYEYGKRVKASIEKYGLPKDDWSKKIKKCLEAGGLDHQAVNALVKSHLSFVVKIAKKYRAGRSLDYAQLSIGNSALNEAALRFDITKGLRFVTLAKSYIESAYKDDMHRSKSLVPIVTTGPLKKAFFGLGKTENLLGLSSPNHQHAHEDMARIAHILSIPVHDVETICTRFGGGEVSIDTPGVRQERSVAETHAAEGLQPDEILIEKEDDERETRRKILLQAALAILSPRELEILIARRLKEPPVRREILANTHSISGTRVRQIEIRSLEKVGKEIMRLEAHANRETCSPIAIPPRASKPLRPEVRTFEVA